MNNLNNPWFKEWFNTPFYHDLYGNRDYNEAEKFIKKLVHLLKLPSSSVCIDLGCGKGRHTNTLAKLNYEVLGLDLSEQSIAFAKSNKTPGASFLEHDMRNPIPMNNVDAVFNLFTSFGYFEDPLVDLKVVSNVFNSLKSGGIFIQDYLNGASILSKLPIKQNIQKDLATYQIYKYFKNNSIHKEIDFTFDKKDYNFTEKVQVYTQSQLTELHTKAGFNVKYIFGNYELANFDSNVSNRIIIISTKP